MAEQKAFSSKDELALSAEEEEKPNGLQTESVEEQDAEGEPDDEEDGEEIRAEGAEEDEYHDAAAEADSDVEVPEPLPPRRRTSQRGQQQRNDKRKAAQGENESPSEESVANSSDEEDDDAAWEADANDAGEDEEEQDLADTSHCLFCGQDENDDPSEEFEEILACASCGSKAHRQCAREASLLEPDDDGAAWLCSTCLQDGQATTQEALHTLQHSRRDSAPKLARDLLPYQRGVPKPGSHSIFNTLIVEDDPMDGSRALRKRKPSVDEDDKAESRKRQRRATSEAAKTRQPSQDRTMSPRSRAGPLSIQNADAQPQSPPTARLSRSRGTRRTERQLVTIVEPRTDDCITLAFHLGSDKLRNLDEEKRKRKRRDKDKHQRTVSHQDMPEVNHYPALQPASFLSQSLFDRESDATKGKPYGGILSEAEADTTRTFPQSGDRKKFEDARQRAEQGWKLKAEAQQETEPSKPAPKSGMASKVKCINFAGFEIDTWHAAPYPEEYSRNRVLHICEFCLKYMNSDYVAWRHKLKCPAKHPPGDEIYRDGAISFFEVDGRKNPVYCQNLCLLAKLFLGSKTLYYDVEPFLFYIMTETDDYGCHFVGYFSKEKRPSSQNNVSCILVLPIHQRRGFGNLLIEFSYLLTRVEGKTGSPEKPLSDMGLVTYRSYWRLVMCNQLLQLEGAVSIATLSERTGMTADDIVCALEGLRALVRDPVTKTYALRLDYAYYKRYTENYDSKGYIKLNYDALMWVPYVMGRDNMHYENTAPLHTVAQRDDDDNDEREREADSTRGHDEGAATDTIPETETPVEEREAETLPFPSLDSLDTSKQPSTRVTPQTPFVDNPSQPSSPIPATRFEVFPPLPGNANRKRFGRTPRSGRRHAAGGLSYADSPASATEKPTSLRRGRSQLAEEIHGDEEDEEDAAGEPDVEDSPAPGRGVAAVDEDADGDGDVEMAEAPE